MDAGFILELFIKGAETEAKMPANGERPKKVKSQSFGYVHSFEDMRQWGTERLEEHRRAFWTGMNGRVSAEDVSSWELCNDLMKQVRRERDRRCLWAYARSKMERPRSFSAWCKKDEGIHRNYGKACADRAVEEILLFVDCKPLQHKGNHETCTLQDEADFEHKAITLGEGAPDERRTERHWMAPDAKPLHFDDGLHDFDWAEARNAKRREQYRQRKTAA
ncbi:hypothetical protein [Limoniibacter endophyticus]|uniref:Uncharacterized protein n=2 Tax=Limoniibacter endophyticus TaxID=1565040 RepID=A0A8J3DQ81_9HYPH|nr:hypothetical protein [Limoniibacter endophyticus]GHC79483.1 hypothetical protein GCM10010136_32060 [Limoniibacter endophyticus]